LGWIPTTTAMPDPIGQLLRSLFDVQRIGTTVNAEAQVVLDELFDELVLDLQRRDPTAPGAERWRRYRTDQFLVDVAHRLRETVPEWERVVRAGLAVAGRAQAQRAEQIILASLGDASSRLRPTPITQARVRAILTSEPFQGATLSEWAAGIERTTLDRISKQIKLGMTLEEPLSDLVRRVRGEQAGYIRQDPATGQFVPKGRPGAIVRPRFIGGVWQATTREAESVVRSAVSFVDGESKLETYRQNATLIKAIEFVAVLDDRTTPVCFDLDGTMWEPDSKDIRVPGRDTHFGGCRSELVPHIDYERLGLPAPPEGTRVARDMSALDRAALERRIATRRSRGELGKSTPVPARLRYEGWLRDQSVAVQEEVLGVRRARLFREGKMGLRELVKSDGRLIPVKDLLAA
jgi:SPP1 gp7 family putative phage head morphogenesis protein